MRVLITGGSGFVGANLVRRLLNDGHELHLLVRAEANLWRLETVRAALHLHPINLLDRDGVKTVVAQIKPDWVFHLAVYGAYSFQNDMMKILETNVMGTAYLLEACEQTGFAAFVNTGSSSEYGFKAHPPLETETLEPNSYYAVGKASATMLCSYTARRLNLPIPTLRLYSVYGPYEEARRLIPRLIRLGLEGRYPTLASPNIARDFVYSVDVVNAYLKAATMTTVAPGAIYNIGSGVQTRLSDIVETVRTLLNISEAPLWNSMEQRSWDTEVWVSEPAKARQELGWQTTYNLADGLAATAEWLRENQQHYPLD